MFASRCTELSSFKVMDILEKAQKLERSGRDIIHLQIGEPDFSTPDCIKEAACKAIRDGKTQYTHSQGIIELREAISDHYAQEYNVSVHPDQVFVTPGTSPAMLLTFSALLQQGDSVILSDPCYACYPNFIRYAGAHCQRVPVYEQDGFQFRVADIQKHLEKRTKGILINSPANPTGTLLSAQRLQRICDLGLTVFSDEIYHGLVYEGQEHSALEYTPNCIVFNGFSKLYAMTGWRLGYMLVPKSLVPTMLKIQQNFLICTSAVAQWAGLAAFRDPLSQTIEDPLHSENEERFVLIGRSIQGRLLIIVHTNRGERIRIISARQATKKERFKYEENEE